MRLLIAMSLLITNLLAELAFLGLVDNKWQIMLLENGKIKPVPTEFEPHSFDYDFQSNKIIYIASDESLRLIEKGNETVILKKDKDSYIQPTFSKDTKKIYLVKLFDGTSKKSDIIEVTLDLNKTKTVVEQRSTQLEPYTVDGKNLYYTNVICTIGCRGIISEIWHKNIISGEAKQLTLTNATSQQAVIDEKAKQLYYSSNQDGNFHIWNYDLANKKYRQLTKGDVTDGFPIISNNRLYFVRQIEADSELMVMDKKGVITKVVLPDKIKKIRYLRSK